MNNKIISLLFSSILAAFLISCSDDDFIDDRKLSPDIPRTKPQLLSMGFSAEDNPEQLIEDITCTIVGDSLVECWIPYSMDNKHLIPRFSFSGTQVKIDGDRSSSSETCHDFSRPVTLTVMAHSLTKHYQVLIHAFTGLPVLWITTENREEISSKENYLNAHLRLVKDVVTRAAGETFEADVQIKGRGNSSWSGSPKKSYRLKFDQKVSLLDEPQDKSWVLLANYFDKTSIRNATAFYISQISNLDYTPRSHFVELMLNGRYNGTYQLTEKLKLAKNRVNVGEDGYLLQIDKRSVGESATFYVSHIGSPFKIEDSSLELTPERIEYVRKYVAEADSILYSDNFTDPQTGWRKYMDMDSFVDWYLVNEIAKNNDAHSFSSCYLNMQHGGKLKYGPCWDFDIAFGNIDYSDCHSSDGFWIKISSPWFSRLFKDPAFVAKVKERYDYFYSRKDDIMNSINQNAQYLQRSVVENENRWGTFYTYTWPNYDIWGSYLNEVQSMKIWLSERME